MTSTVAPTVSHNISARSYFSYLIQLAGIGTLLSNLLRVILLFLVPHDAIPHFGGLLSSFAIGIFFDLCSLAYALIPFFFAYIVLPQFALRPRGLRLWLAPMTTLFFFVLFFSAVSEIIFWGEFHSRYNFIAVDYLVYTNEVLRNIWESYHVVWIVTSVLICALLCTALCLKSLRRARPSIDRWRDKALVLIVGTLILTPLFLWVDESKIISSPDYVERELSKNGIHTLFTAYRHNELEYAQFYSMLPSNEAFARVQKKLSETDPTEFKNSNSITHIVKAEGAFKDYNIIMVVMESMSARFMGVYGAGQQITPQLDRLAREGLFFHNLFATGTRTVRGLEAVTLSVPPTPGQSILRRPNYDHLYNIGSVLESHGYERDFVYGGHSFFDNMGAFFAGNGFKVHDQADFDSARVHFSNVWGICDEDLFSMAIDTADAANQNGKPFLQVIMTTSNHRPYTFPADRIDIPSGTGRDGAVKYADWAAGDFVERARKHKWFAKTLFVFVSDHNASVGGGVDVPISDYLIPFIIYAPEIYQPKTYDLLASQIDVPTTLLGLLNTSYESHFYGVDLLREKGGGRAFISNYQKLGYVEGDQLVLLSPVRAVDRYKVNWVDLTKLEHLSNEKDVSDPASRDDFLKDAVSYYQSASELFTTGKMRR